MAAEIGAIVSENSLSYLKSNLIRVTWPDIPAPASRSLEAALLSPRAAAIVDAVKISLE